MLNERITENIVRNLLRERGYYSDDNIFIEEQSSRNPKINKLLKNASKSGDGTGRPEFIISFKNNPDDLIVVECKASISQHESKDRTSYKDYAVDGVLLYASYLKDSFNVTAIAVSGENEKEKKISNFLWLKRHYTYKDIQDKIFLKSSEIENIIKEQLKPFAEDDLIARAIEYNSFLHNYSIPEVERCTLISAILIALQNEPFLKSYKYYASNRELIEALLLSCESVLKKNNLDIEKTKIIISEYSKFKNNNDFNSDVILNKKTKKDEVNNLLRDFISSINQDILPHINESEFDVLGKFYTQFIRYAGSDKKTGLVLTPTHITDLFCEIAELNDDDVVFDPCCGTAGFLVSAMNYMLKKAGNDTEKQKAIKSNQLIGIEKRPDMFSHACSNMMMRGDGKSHILYGNCFDDKNKDIIKSHKPTKGFLNPPYQDGNADEQLEFIENTLDCLAKDGICVAICQMSTVVSDDKKVLEVKKRLLEKHTLEAVLSMPNDLFHPVGVNTCIIVFKAHNTHSSNKKTFFGYFKDDGFMKQKNKGRIDKELKWNNIKSKWLKAFINKESIESLSITHIVRAETEWCAEAYIKTDYSILSLNIFSKTVKDYVGFLFCAGLISEANNLAFKEEKITLEAYSWKIFNLITLFDMKAGKYYPRKSYNEGYIPLISASENNNGVIKFTDLEPKYNNCLTIGKIGISTFYQNIPFVATSDVTILIPKIENFNKYLGLFIATILNQEKYKWSYGRQIRLNDCQKLTIKLPVTTQGLPDWEFMENYIKSLPYSASL